MRRHSRRCASTSQPRGGSAHARSGSFASNSRLRSCPGNASFMQRIQYSRASLLIAPAIRYCSLDYEGWMRSLSGKTSCRSQRGSGNGHQGRQRILRVCTDSRRCTHRCLPRRSPLASQQVLKQVSLQARNRRAAEMSISSVSSQPQIKEADRRHDGRHLRDASGTQLCFAWNRSSDGCAAVCPGSRAHMCAWCLGSHRAVACPQHPTVAAAKCER